eukprot:gene11697-2127_t
MDPDTAAELRAIRQEFRPAPDVQSRHMRWSQAQGDYVETDGPTWAQATRAESRPLPAAPAGQAAMPDTGTYMRQHNLTRRPYGGSRNHRDASYWTLRSGCPFPSYSENPEKAFPPRMWSVPGFKEPCEEIRAPRIRLGPDELPPKQPMFTAVHRHHQALVREERQAKGAPPRIQCLNLGYQNLGDKYQVENLAAFMKMNRGATKLALSDNHLTDMRACDLPLVQELVLAKDMCSELFLARNSIPSFLMLPSLPACTKLSLAENRVSDTKGLTPERFPNLTSLVLRGNPIAQDEAYRARVPACKLPKLALLDGSP